MATIEVQCGKCGERLDVEPEQAAIECPHCHSQLQIPSDCRAGSELPVSGEAAEGPAIEAEGTSIHEAGAVDVSEIVVPSSIKEPDFRNWGAAAAARPGADGPPSATGIAPPLSEDAVAEEHSQGDLPQAVSTNPTVDSEAPDAPLPSPAPPDAADSESEEQLEPTRPLPEPATKTRRHRESTTSVRGGSEGDAGISRNAFLGLVAYASVMTAVCLGLIFLLATHRTHQLESLPDVVPQRSKNGKIAHYIVPPDAKIAPGHRLKLGQSQRFGDLLVTPLRVTREPLEFTYFQEGTTLQGDETREPAGDVLKLWLRFENVGDGRAFSPLGPQLLFYRRPAVGHLEANNFLTPLEGDRQKLIPLYNHPLHSTWNLAGQDLGRVLAPGETWTTYAPSDLDVPPLEGRWVWRLHLRKGIAANGWGVTTLIEVTFDADAIETSSSDLAQRRIPEQRHGFLLTASIDSQFLRPPSIIDPLPSTQ